MFLVYTTSVHGNKEESIEKWWHWVCIHNISMNLVLPFPGDTPSHCFTPFRFNALWLAAFRYANPLFLVGISFLIYAFLFTSTFSGTLLGRNTVLGCSMILAPELYYNTTITSLMSTQCYSRKSRVYFKFHGFG